MAKVLLYNKSVADSIFINGILDKNARSITYSENDEIKKTSVQSLLREFASKKVDFIIFIEYEKEQMINIDQYKNSEIIGTMDETETMICGVLDENVKIIKGIL